MSLAIGWFSSGRDEAACQLLRIVLDRIDRGEIPGAGISFVFSNREEGESVSSDRFLRMVRRAGIPLICRSSRDCAPELRREGLRRAHQGDDSVLRRWRRVYDRQVLEALAPWSTDVGMLAGYMLILGAELCRRLRAVNLHPALPGGPRGTWQEVIWQLIAERARTTGATVHRVTPELDAGPPLCCWSFSLRTHRFLPLWAEMKHKRREKGWEKVRQTEGESEPLFRAIREEGVRRELPLMVVTLQNLAGGRITLPDQQVAVDGRVGQVLRLHDEGDPDQAREWVD